MPNRRPQVARARYVLANAADFMKNVVGAAIPPRPAPAVLPLVLQSAASAAPSPVAIALQLHRTDDIIAFYSESTGFLIEQVTRWRRRRRQNLPSLTPSLPSALLFAVQVLPDG